MKYLVLYGGYFILVTMVWFCAFRFVSHLRNRINQVDMLITLAICVGIGFLTFLVTMLWVIMDLKYQM